MYYRNPKKEEKVLTLIKKSNDRFGVYNGAGIQVEGSFSPDSSGLSPKEMLEGSLAMCTVIVLQRMFERDGVEVSADEFSVEVKAIKATDSPSRFEKCEMTITLPDHFSDAYKRKLIVSAERACTIGNTLRTGITVVTNEHKK